jgi:hypothetical protein
MSILDAYSSGEAERHKSHFRNLAKIALADGSLDAPEMEFLQHIAKELGHTPEEVEDVMANIKELPFTPPSSKEDRFYQMYNLIRMVLADDIVEPNEITWSRRFAIGLGFPHGKVDTIINGLIDIQQKGGDKHDCFEFLEDTVYP